MPHGRRSKASDGTGPSGFVPGMQVAVTPEQAARLAVLVRLNISFEEYCSADLPVTVGRLSREQRRLFAPNARYRHLDYKRLFHCTGPLSPGDLQAVAKDLTRSGQGSGAAPGTVAKLQPIVADILQTDYAIFGACPEYGRSRKIGLVFSQDLPGANYTRDPAWHQDYRFSPGDARMPGRMYIIRSTCPTEIIRDRMAIESGYEFFRECFALYADSEKNYSDFRIKYSEWEKAIGEAGMFFRPRSNEVTLISANWHRSHRPDREVRSTFMLVAIR